MSFQSKSISEIRSLDGTVFAFKIDGHIDDDESEALAEYMNDAFDKHDSVCMLMDLTAYDGSDWDSLFDWEVIKSRVRSLGKVEKYAVIGASKNASKMIELFDRVLPVEAKSFDAADADKAWQLVGAKPYVAA